MENVASTPALVNQPDEEWLIQAPCFSLRMDGPLDICRVAVLLMACGSAALLHYPRRDQEGGWSAPFPAFPFGGYDEWAKHSGFDAEQVAIPANASEIARALRTVRPSDVPGCEEHTAAALAGIALLAAALEEEGKRVLS